MKKMQLAQERIKRDWTQEYVAEQCSVSKQTVYDWENGRRKPSFNVLMKLCKLFNVPHAEVEQLFAVANDKESSN